MNFALEQAHMPLCTSEPCKQIDILIHKAAPG